MLKTTCWPCPTSHASLDTVFVGSFKLSVDGNWSYAAAESKQEKLIAALGCTKSLPCEELEQVWGWFPCLFVLIHEQFSTKNTFCILMA